ncbi:MAG: mannose-1-phosphate guanylyltransferase [Parcubacteria bacterium C7867-008]|nr:MAG: mannose-1-phosphate guanylyltransferase [Parcubacteria bacterium C7867-008]
MLELSHRYHEDRPWGSFDRFTENEPSEVKFLNVEAGKRFSLQRHSKRSEFWKTIKGSGVAEVDGIEYPMEIDSEVTIPLGSTHRLTGGPNGITVLEIALGEFDEDDIERLEDDFGRVAENTHG